MLLIRDAAFIVTLDERRRILKGHSVLVKEGRIADLGTTAQLDDRHGQACAAHGEVIEAAGCLLLPGYVNTHVHTFEHLSRGLIPDDLATYDWAVKYARPFYAALTEEEACLSARLACIDMLSNGTTTFVDVNILRSSAHLDAVAQAVDESGMRAVLGRGVFDRMPEEMARQLPAEAKDAVLSRSAASALAEVDALLARGRSLRGGRIQVWASIYGLMSYCSDELFAGIARLAERHGCPVAFHIASSIEEARSLEARAGVWPITHLERLGVLGSQLLLTHCTAVTDEEVDLLARREVKVAFCPGAALRLAKGTTRIGKIPEMLARGVTVSLGADGVSSSGTFDPIRLACLVAGLYKDARMDPRQVPAETALEMATINGARATMLDSELGAVAIGNKADLTLYDVTGPQWAPAHDIVRNLVYCADGRSVICVLVDGKTVLDRSGPRGLDAAKVISEAHETGARIARRLGLSARTRWPVVG